jgi:hypothetical protein
MSSGIDVYPAQHSNAVREEVASITVAQVSVHAAVDVTEACNCIEIPL